MTSDSKGDVRVSGKRFWSDLRYLVRTFPTGTNRRLAAYAVSQFFVSFLDLAGLAAVLPVIQVVMGASIDSGYIGDIHRLLDEPPRSTFVVELCALMVLAFGLKSALAMLISWWQAGFVARLQVVTGANLLSSYLNESYLVQRRRDVGRVVRTVGTSVAAAHSLVLGGVLSIFGQILSVTFVIVFLAFVAPVPTIAAVIYFGLVVLVLQRVLGVKNRAWGQVAQETAMFMNRAMLESIYAAREVRMHDAAGFFVANFRDAASTNGLASRSANFFAQAPKYILEFCTILGIALLLCFAALTNDAANLIPVLTLFVAAAIKLLPTMTALTVTLGNVRYGQEGLAMTVESLRQDASKQLVHVSDDYPAGARQSGSRNAVSGLSVRGMSFGYPDGTRCVLRDVSFNVDVGDSLALCGLSGSGKTTLVDVVLGLLPPSDGAVTFDGVDVSSAGKVWRDRVAYVPQDVYLFAAPLWANVAFGLAEHEVDKDKVRSCLQMAQLGEFVDDLDGGVHALVGSAGTQLSGGQKQRVGIARALYRNPDVLVLDEATSALDNETEDRIAQVIRDLHGRVTTIVVAHRLSTVKHADNILYLEDGRITASGRFDELQRRSPAFRHLVELGSLDSDVSES